MSPSTPPSDTPDTAPRGPTRRAVVFGMGFVAAVAIHGLVDDHSNHRYASFCGRPHADGDAIEPSRVETLGLPRQRRHPENLPVTKGP